MSEMPGTQMDVGSWSPKPVEQMRSDEGYSGLTNPSDWLVSAIGGGPAWSGIRVNGWTVLTSGPVYQAVNLISSDLAVLPIDVLVHDGDGSRKKEKNHPIYRIWNEDGNEEMLPFNVRQTLQSWALIYGNGIGAIHWEGDKPIGVYPLHPHTVHLERLPFTPELGQASGELVYRVFTQQGHEEILFQHEVFHIKILGNGIWGHSPLGLFRNTFGNGLAVEKFQGKSFANSSRPSGVLETDKTKSQFGAEARANLRREWNEAHQGLDNTGKIAVLWDGLTWKAMSVTNEESQMIESRKFYREEVAAIYNIPPHKLGAMENSAVRANIEEQERSYAKTTLMPHSTNWEQECRKKLMTRQQRRQRTHAARFNYKAMLRADHKSRNEAYAIGRQWGWYSVNDILRLEDMDQIGDEGDIRLVPSNMANLETGEAFTTPQQPAQQQLPPPSDDQETMRSARRELMAIQTTEVKNLRNAMQSNQTSFHELAMAYYSTFGEWMCRRLESYCFEPPQPLVNAYVEQSLTAIADIETMSDLLTMFVDWPARAESLLLQLPLIQKQTIGALTNG